MFCLIRFMCHGWFPALKLLYYKVKKKSLQFSCSLHYTLHLINNCGSNFTFLFLQVQKVAVCVFGRKLKTVKDVKSKLNHGPAYNVRYLTEGTGLLFKLWHRVPTVTGLSRHKICWCNSHTGRCQKKQGETNQKTDLFRKPGFRSRLWITKSLRGRAFNSMSPMMPERYQSKMSQDQTFSSDFYWHRWTYSYLCAAHPEFSHNSPCPSSPPVNSGFFFPSTQKHRKHEPQNRVQQAAMTRIQDTC